MNIVRNVDMEKGKNYKDGSWVITNEDGKKILEMGPLLKQLVHGSIETGEIAIKEMINDTLAHLGIEYDSSSIGVFKAEDGAGCPLNQIRIRVEDSDTADAFCMEWRFRYPDYFCRNLQRVGKHLEIWGYIY